MRKPRKAFLLAAGYGMRMRPLTNTVPKPLMPVWGRRGIDHMIELLAGWGVRELLVNLHHEAGAIVEHLLGRKGGPRIHFSFEPEILGTGGALVRAEWFFGAEPFWVANTDIAADLSPVNLLKDFETRRPLATLWMHPDKGPRTVELSDGAVTNFRSTTPGIQGRFTFCGLQLVSPELSSFLKGERFHSIVDAYEEAMKAGHRISGVVVPHSFWADLGNPGDYIAAHRDILRAYRTRVPGGRLMQKRMLRCVTSAREQGAQVKGFAAIGERVSFHPGAEIEDSVIWPGATIGSRGVVKRSIVGRGARVNVVSTGPVVRATDYNETPAFRGILDDLGFSADSAVALPLPSRGSNRSFTRLACGSRMAMLIHYNLARPENARFAGHARFLLENGVPVPRILVDMPREQMVVAEDIGNRSLEDEARAVSPKQLEMHYRRVLDALLTMHGIPIRLLKLKRSWLEPAFSSKVYRWERELMAKYFLQGRLHLPDRAVRDVLGELSGIAEKLLYEPKVLVHRDMQSSNVLLRRGGTVFIDFQGMRMGPPAYDLASLLCDPYVMLAPAIQKRLLEYYLTRCDKPESVERSFWPAAVQRLSQALGAYGRLSAIPGTGRFAHYIRSAREMLSRALSHMEGLPSVRRIAWGETTFGSPSEERSSAGTGSRSASAGEPISNRLYHGNCRTAVTR